MKSVAVLVGSLRTQSNNKKLAHALERLTGDMLHFEYVDMHLPLFNEDDEANTPESVERARSIVARADIVLMVTPEYNRSIPGVLKNAIDWLSRPNGSDVLRRKKVAIVGATTGSLGTGPAQAHLRSIIGYLAMPYLGQPEFYLNVRSDTFTEAGDFMDDTFARAYIDSLLKFAES
jgi:chromate reductase